MKVVYKLIVSVFMVFFIFSCKKENEEYFDNQYKSYADSIDNSISEYIDSLPIEDISTEDFIMSNGNNVFEFLETYDNSFIEDNPWIYEYSNFTKSSKIYSSLISSNSSVVTGNAGIINLKNDIIANITLSSLFLLNNSQGEATNSVVANTIATHNQKGLWYKWGGKEWDRYGYPAQGGEPLDGKSQMCYGLDCSGLVYSALNSIGFKIGVSNASGYYSADIWNTALTNYLTTKNQFSEEIKKNIRFEKYSYSSKLLTSNVQPGDIIFFNNGKGIYHIGIITGSDKKIAQSNGQQHPNSAKDNYLYNGKYRGPHLISVENAANYWGVTTFGIIRLVATLNNTHWRMNIKCENKTTYITTFDIEINMKDVKSGEIAITPVSTKGYDYGGEACDVYFTGTFNIEKQILKGQIQKTYSSSKRTDKFEIKLNDDNISNIYLSKVVSNGGCTNYLDLENLDIKKQSSLRILNNSISTIKENDCTDNTPSHK